MTERKRERVDPIKSRIANIGENIIPIGDGWKLSRDVTKLVAETAQQLAYIVESGGAGTYDMGRLIRSLDLLDQVKHAAHQAISLPNYRDGPEKRPNPPIIMASKRVN